MQEVVTQKSRLSGVEAQLPIFFRSGTLVRLLVRIRRSQPYYVQTHHNDKFWVVGL